MAKPELLPGEKREMHAKGLYNLKLAQSMMKKGEAAGEIVGNDLDFDADHRLYILTGANRGGKTTITQPWVSPFFLPRVGSMFRRAPFPSARWIIFYPLSRR